MGRFQSRRLGQIFSSLSPRLRLRDRFEKNLPKSPRLKPLVFLNMLEVIDQNIWVARAAILPFGTYATMTIVRLLDGKLVVISPIPLSNSLKAEIDGLGEVTAVVSPSRFHHMFAYDVLQHYPQARFFYSPAVLKKTLKKIDQLSCEQFVLSSSFLKSSELAPILVDGMPKIEEFVFYHSESKTLIATDFLFMVKETKNFWLKIFWKLLGITPLLPSQSRYFRSHIKDRQAYNASLLALKSLPIKRIIVAHEMVIEGDALKHAQKILSTS
jgi:hypothetical protein